MGVLRLLSGGAAQALVTALSPSFESETGYRVEGVFGAVGAMRDRLLDGEVIDLVILTSSLVRELADAGLVLGNDAADLGSVATSIAIRLDSPVPAISDADGLRKALLEADAIYFPDPEKATAGIHFASVMDRLGIRGQLDTRLRPFSNGRTAMSELARSKDRAAIGCTQATEILATPGLKLLGPLPPAYGLSTTYTAAPCKAGPSVEAAKQLIRCLAGTEAADARRRTGFV